MLEVMKPLEMPDVNITIPDSYEKSSTDSNKTVFLKDDASIIVNEDVFTEEYKTLDEYVDYAVEVYKKYSSSLDLLKNEVVTVGGLNGKLVEYIYTLDTENGEFSKYCMTAFFSDGEKLYLITCKADTDTYNDYHSEFMETVNSFSLKN